MCVHQHLTVDGEKSKSWPEGTDQLMDREKEILLQSRERGKKKGIYLKKKGKIVVFLLLGSCCCHGNSLVCLPYSPDRRRRVQ